jgi:hypothetical protein
MDQRDREERRKCERRHFGEYIRIDDSMTCVCSDISENGLYACMMQPLEKNRMVDVTIPLEGKKIFVRARVEYVHPGIGVGLIFIDLNDEQRSMLRELIKGIKE